VIENAQAMTSGLVAKGYDVISGGTDNHCMLIDLRNKGLTGKDAEIALVSADLTVNKNMVPFDDQSPFVTSGIRIGTAAITTRGSGPEECARIVELIDRVIMDHTNESVLSAVKKEANALMSSKTLFSHY
jgi:glycine hydroxymethyltransferase